MGFCYLNNIALAAEALRAEAGCGRVAVVDFDVHHGNGTQDAFYGRDDVLFVSLHQYPYYPGSGSARETGHGPGEGYTVNLPMPAGAGDASYALAFDRVVVPVLDHFAPHALLISVGADGHFADRMGGFELSTHGFLMMTEKLIAVADRHGPGRVACVLEGGYHLDSLAEVIAAIVARFRNKQFDLKFTDNAEPAPIAEGIIEIVRASIMPHHDLR
jgi:acetoin utilization deacetylase AcuC-like enzyme